MVQTLVWSKFTHESLSLRFSLLKSDYFGVSLCVSVCNSSPCSQQSLPRWALPQEQYSQHARSTFREIFPYCLKNNHPQHARTSFENFHIAKFLCSLVFRPSIFYLLVGICPCTLFSQQLLWACNVHWLLSIVVLVTFCRYLQSRGNFLTA